MKRFLFLLPLVACGVEPEGYELEEDALDGAELEEADTEQLDRYSACMDGEVPSIANTGASCWTATYRCGKINGSFGCVQSGWVGPSTIWCVSNAECVADDLGEYNDVPGVGDFCQCGSGAPDADGWTHVNPYE